MIISVLLFAIGVLISAVVVSRMAIEYLWFRHQYPNCTRTSWLHLLPFDQINLTENSQYGPNPYGEYSVAVSMFLQFLHIPEFVALLWGYWGYKKEEKVCCQCCCMCSCRHENKWSWCSSIFSVLILFLYFAVGFFVGLFQLSLAYCQTDAPSSWLPQLRGTLSLLVHIVTFSARSFMAWQCICVFSVFWKEITNIKGIDPSVEVANTIHKKLTEEYKEVADKVGPIIGIFTSWFFIMWILYTIGTITNVVYVLRVWFLTISLSETQLIYESLYIVYNLLSYGIPYILALELKGCHKKYYKELKDKQAAFSKDKDLYGYTTTMRIMKRDDCNFIPSLFGITLPLESIQFAIPILLPIITLTFAFLKV